MRCVVDKALNLGFTATTIRIIEEAERETEKLLDSIAYTEKVAGVKHYAKIVERLPRTTVLGAPPSPGSLPPKLVAYLSTPCAGFLWA
jgi:hypothetical protein